MTPTLWAATPERRRAQHSALGVQERLVAAGYHRRSPCIASHDWLSAEAEKALLRWARHEKLHGPREHAWPWDVALREFRDFWATYELVNRERLPHDPTYTAARGNFTLSTTADVFSFTSPASGQARILEIYVGGEATTSAVNRLSYQRSTGGATPTNQTPELTNPLSPAAAGTVATTWTTQPTLSGGPWYQLGLNAFGGSDRMVLQPNSEFYMNSGGKSSIRAASGSSVVDLTAAIEEL